MSKGIVSVGGLLIIILVLGVMTGRGYEGNPGPAAGRAGSDDPLLEAHRAVERGALRVARDTARNRTWVLGVDDVRVYDTVTHRLIRQIALPSWSLARFVCAPDMVLDRSGSAFIASNVLAKLWRIDADSLEVKEQEIRLEGKERWDVGFGALAFAADGALYALTSSAGSLWKIDVAKASASMIEHEGPPLRGCAFTTQFLKDFERSRKPWMRPSLHQN